MYYFLIAASFWVNSLAFFFFCKTSCCRLVNVRNATSSWSHVRWFFRSNRVLGGRWVSSLATCVLSFACSHFRTASLSWSGTGSGERMSRIWPLSRILTFLVMGRSPGRHTRRQKFKLLCYLLMPLRRFDCGLESGMISGFTEPLNKINYIRCLSRPTGHVCSWSSGTCWCMSPQWHLC